MAVANTLAYFASATITAVKSLIVGPVADVIKLLTAAIYKLPK
jgi:hypothetical protein